MGPRSSQTSEATPRRSGRLQTRNQTAKSRSDRRVERRLTKEIAFYFGTQKIVATSKPERRPTKEIVFSSAFIHFKLNTVALARANPWRRRRHRAENTDRAEKHPDEQNNSTRQLLMADSKTDREMQQRVPSRWGASPRRTLFIFPFIYLDVKTIPQVPTNPWHRRRRGAENADRAEKQADQPNNSTPQVLIED